MENTPQFKGKRTRIATHIAARTTAYRSESASACANNPKSAPHNGGNGPTSQRLVYVGVGQYSQSIASDVATRYSVRDTGKRARLADWLQDFGYEGK